MNQGNVALIVTKGDLKEVREEVPKYKLYVSKVIKSCLPSSVAFILLAMKSFRKLFSSAYKK